MFPYTVVLTQFGVTRTVTVHARHIGHAIDLVQLLLRCGEAIAEVYAEAVVL